MIGNAASGALGWVGGICAQVSVFVHRTLEVPALIVVPLWMNHRHWDHVLQVLQRPRKHDSVAPPACCRYVQPVSTCLWGELRALRDPVGVQRQENNGSCERGWVVSEKVGIVKQS